MRIDLSCAQCGRNRFAFPESGGDDAMVTCRDCGHQVGTLGDLKRRVEIAVTGGSPRQRGAALPEPSPG